MIEPYCDPDEEVPSPTPREEEFLALVAAGLPVSLDPQAWREMDDGDADPMPPQPAWDWEPPASCPACEDSGWVEGMDAPLPCGDCPAGDEAGNEPPHDWWGWRNVPEEVAA